jgi:hypothetical protein
MNRNGNDAASPLGMRRLHFPEPVKECLEYKQVVTTNDTTLRNGEQTACGGFCLRKDLIQTGWPAKGRLRTGD